MRASSPSSCGAGAVGVATSEHEPPAPQPFGLRDPHHVGHGIDPPRRGSIGQPERKCAPSRSAAAARAGSMPGPKPIGASRRLAGEEPPELAPLGRLEGAERAAQQRDHVGERVAASATTATGRRGRAGRRRGPAPCRCRRGSPRRTRRRSPAACPATAPGRGGARRARASQSPASCSRRVARPWTQPVRRPSASSLEHLGVGPRAAPDGRPAPAPAWTPLMRSTITARRVVVERRARRRRRRPAPARRVRRTPCAATTRRWRARRRSAGRGRADRAPPSAGRRRDRWRRAPRAGRRSARRRRRDGASSARSRAAAELEQAVGVRRPLDEPVGRRLLDGGAVPGELDEPHRQLGLPRHPPRLAERPARAAALLERAPPHAERDELVQEVRPAPDRSACAGRARPPPARHGLEPHPRVAGRAGRGRAAPAVHPAGTSPIASPTTSRRRTSGRPPITASAESSTSSRPGTRPAAQHRQRLGHPRTRR